MDTTREHIAVKEAQKLNIPIFAMVDTNSDPRAIDYVIPSNDDASKSIEKIISSVTNAITEGLAERKSGKESEATTTETAAPEAKAAKEVKAPRKRAAAVAAPVPATKEEE